MISNRVDTKEFRAGDRFSRRRPAGRAGGGMLGLSILAAAYVACGGSTNATSNDGGAQASDDSGIRLGGDDGGGPVMAQDAGSGPTSDAAQAHDAASDVGGPSTTYPAFKVDVAQVQNLGGSVLAAPVIVTITWASDPNAETWNALGDSIGASSYWHTINSEYGVGAATSGASNHVSITTAAPSEMADSDLDSFVSAHAGVDWPAPTTNTIYAVYMDPTTTLYLGGPPDAGGQDGCAQGVGGYHTQTQDSKGLVYAIMPHCSMFQAADIELGATHELNEASTDPRFTPPAYITFDQNHLAFEFFNSFQDELGDACESFVESTDAVDFSPYTVQRQWSNKSAAAGSHWCVPALAEPFYNTTFLIGEPAGIPTTQLDTITADLSSLQNGFGMTTSKGFKMALNTTRTFPIGYFSDQDTKGPFTLDVQWPTDPQTGANIIAVDGNGNPITNGTATVTIDKTSGVNGDIANVTITPTAYSSLGLTFFYIRSVLPNSQQHHYLPILISQN